MQLEPFVSLYRLAGRPPLDGTLFCGTVRFNDACDQVEEILANPLARFEDLHVDGRDLIGEKFPSDGNEINFRLRLPTSSDERFYENLDDMLRWAPTVSRGRLPEEFYLVSEDYFSNDAEEPKDVTSLKKICRFIGALSELAHYHDEKPSSGYYRLVFIHPTDDPSIKPVELDTLVSSEVIKSADDLDPQLVEELAQSSAANDPHHMAKVGVFGTSLASFIDRAPASDGFIHLVSKWKEFLGEYHRDLGTYLSGFAFHKAKTEVAQAEIKIAHEFSKVLSDITGKLLTIPISIAAIIAIPRAGSFVEQVILLAGLLVASIIVFGTVSNQKRQFARIKNSKNLLVGAIEGKQESYPDDLKKVVNDLRTTLERDERSLGRVLSLFFVLAWLPFVFGLLVLSWVHLDGICSATGPLPSWDWVINSCDYLMSLKRGEH